MAARPEAFPVASLAPAGRGLAYEISGVTIRTPRAARSNSAKKGDATPSGCTAEQTSCKTPGYSGSGAVRAPPPGVCWPSMTRTDSPARAQMTAAASPLGPLPTTVTSTT